MVRWVVDSQRLLHLANQVQFAVPILVDLPDGAGGMEPQAKALPRLVAVSKP